MCGQFREAQAGGIPLYWRRGRTIGRFHPIAQKQKTDLNIPLGIGQTRSRDAKTKAAGNLVAGSIGARRGREPRQAAAGPERAGLRLAGLGQEESGLGRAQPRLKPSKSRTLGSSPSPPSSSSVPPARLLHRQQI